MNGDSLSDSVIENLFDLMNLPDDFAKGDFIIRKSDVRPSNIPSCLWSIENHVLILKWLPTDDPHVFRVTDRYCLWNSMEPHRYFFVNLSEDDIVNARRSGFINLPTFK